VTDREKLAAVFDALSVPIRQGRDSLDKPTKSFHAAGRRFYFNDAGELEKIIDYVARRVKE
jgi:hypothetical protein